MNKSKVITRIWHGRTLPDHSDIYLKYIQETGLKDYLKTPGIISAKILRRVEKDVCHFLTITEWKDIESIKKFAGADFEKARYYPQDKKFHLFSTYNKSSVMKMEINDDSLEMVVRNNDNILRISVIRRSFGELRAPVSGRMSRTIKESVDSEVNLELFDKNNNILYKGTGKNVGLEVTDPGVLKV